jgi:TonB-linked SusC/RagA family outer membrane protein
MKKDLCKVLVMLSRYFLIGFLIQFIAFNTLLGKNGEAQLNAPIHTNLQNVSVRQVFDVIKEKTGYTFVYDAGEINSDKKVDITGKNLSVAEVLDKLTSQLNLSFKKIGNTITLKKKALPNASFSLPPLSVRTPTIPYSLDIVPMNKVLQAFTVSGTVTDSSGNSLIGVSVQVKGTSQGTVTDANGRYKLAASQNAILVFSFIGYQTKEAEINGRETVNVVLFAATTGLNQLVVVGYQSQVKRNLTSAVATVSGDALNKRVATNPTELLQGQLPGLQVTQNSGQPGNEGIQLLIRGVSTFSGAGNSPLVIVDGLPGSLSNLNPNDIESITVLKDAASAAIYGSRGANGVIVVKTKQGRKGAFSISYNYNVGITNATKLPKVITNSATYMELSNQARLNSGLEPLYTQDQIDLYKNATDREKYPNYNWLGSIFQTAYVQNHYINMNGGKDNTTYNVGIGITDQPGAMIGFKYNKYTLALGLTSKVSNRITFGSDINMKYSKQVQPEDGAGDFFLSALAQSPLYPPQMTNGDWVLKAYSNEQGNKNVHALVANNITNISNDYYVQGNLSLNINIMDGLQWENKIGMNYDGSDNNKFLPIIPMVYFSDTSYAGNLSIGTPGLFVGNSTDRYLVGYSQFTFDRQFGNNHVSALAGYQLEHDHSYYIDANRKGAFPSPLLRELNAGPDDNPNNDGSSSDWAIRSYYGNAYYDYKDKYLLGASIRYDGTSRLPAAHRWGLFYSFSGGWRISDEAFLKNVSWINDLKLRGSWGRLGNQNIGTYPYQATLTERDYAFGGNIVTGFAASTLVDPTLTWETTQVTDIGIDLTAFQGRLTFTGDWFSKYTFNILRGSQVPLWLGLNAPTINNGAVRNRGVEFALQFKDKIGQNFTYYVGGNFQTFRNKLVHFGQRAISSNTIMQEGHEMNEYYLYIWDGIFQSQAEIDKSPKQPVTPTPGDLKIKDVNGDGVINTEDRTYVKGIYPSFQYSFNLGGTWKNVDLNIQLYGSQGQKIYVTGWGIEPFRQGSVPTTAWLNAWTPQNHSNTMPKIYDADSYPAVQNYASTYFLKDASFMRIKNIEVGYTLPLSFFKKVSVKSVRFYFDGDNLFTFSKYPGLDPERVGNGNYVNYPQNKVYTFGAMVNF